MKTHVLSMAVAGIVAAVSSAEAQGRNSAGVPPGHMPPAGMCRIWIDGVPPGRQPAPTNCASAERNRPRNARVIYGSDSRRNDDRWDDRRDRGRKDKVKSKGRDRDDRDDRRNVCVDRDRDGICDYREGQGTRYPDNRYPDNRYPDNRYPDNRYPDSRYPSSRLPNGGSGRLPDMGSAIAFSQGMSSNDVRTWLGGRNDVRVRAADGTSQGLLRTAVWVDGSGRVVQVWRNEDGDRQAEAVEVYENGRLVQTVRG